MSEKKRFSEAVFRFNLLYFNCLTTFFFVGIFLRLVNCCNQVAKLAPKALEYSKLLTKIEECRTFAVSDASRREDSRWQRMKR